jgi:hypothetical protein
VLVTTGEVAACSALAATAIPKLSASFASISFISFNGTTASFDWSSTLSNYSLYEDSTDLRKD